MHLAVGLTRAPGPGPRGGGNNCTAPPPRGRPSGGRPHRGHHLVAERGGGPAPGTRARPRGWRRWRRRSRRSGVRGAAPSARPAPHRPPPPRAPALSQGLRPPRAWGNNTRVPGGSAPARQQSFLTLVVGIERPPPRWRAGSGRFRSPRPPPRARRGPQGKGHGGARNHERTADGLVNTIHVGRARLDGGVEGGPAGRRGHGDGRIGDSGGAAACKPRGNRCA